MLTERPWKTEAILRLFLSAVVCFFGGSFLIAGIQYFTSASRGNPWFYVLLAGSLASLATTLVLLRKTWELENALSRLVAVLACLYAGIFSGVLAARLVGTINPSIGQMIISALSLQGAVLLLVRPFLREHQTNWSEGFGLKCRWGQAVVLGIAVGCVFLPVGWLLQDASAELMMRLHVKPEQQQAVQTLQMAHASLGRAVFGFITIVVVPPAEETFFRGILYPWIKQAGYPGLAFWGTSLAFAAIHTNLMSFLPLALFAVTLTFLYERTNNLLAPICAHALFNAANLAKLYILEHTMT
jgi:membrane protease YdiL (CAAX protease family)